MKVNKFLSESTLPEKETIDLEYSNLEFEQFGPVDWDGDYKSWRRCVDWKYTVNKEDVITFLYENCVSDEDMLDWYEVTDEEAESWVINNFDELFEKYKESILEHWEDDAAEDASIHYEDYIDWDSMPGGHDYTFDESMHEDYLDSPEYRIQRYEDEIPELFQKAHDNYMTGMLNARAYADALATIWNALDEIDVEYKIDESI